MLTAQEIIERLQLVPLPREGGYYRETYRSPHRVPAIAGEKAEEKSACTAIYYLLTPDTCSALHRLPSDEVYHFYLGDPVQLLLLSADGEGRTIILGSDLLKVQQLQVVIPRGAWQGSSLMPGGRFALLGTTMAPGFDFSDYEEGERNQLLQRYPRFAELIWHLTPNVGNE